MTEEHKRKIGLANSTLMKQKWRDASYRNANMFRLVEHAKRIGHGNLGKQRTDEQRRKISEQNFRRFSIKENHPRWKGGLPKCLKCSIQLSNCSAKTCKKHRLDVGENSKKWKGGRKMSYMRSRAVRYGATGLHSQVDWLSIKEKYGFMCLCCKRVEPEVKLTEDHIIPISVWNIYIRFHPEIKYQCNDIQNIQPLCSSCNSKKRV